MKRCLFHIVICLFSLSVLAQDWAVNPPLKAVRLGGENNKRVEQSWQHLQEVAKGLTDSLTKHPTDAPLVANAAQVAFALSLEAQALKESSTTLDSLMKMLTATLNPQGYWGKPAGNTLDERQIAVNGLLLKALCEYQRYHAADSVKRHIHDLAHNLFVPNTERFEQYTLKTSRPWWHKLLFWKRDNSGWAFSKPRGMLLEGMTGVMQACMVLRDSTLAPVVDAFVNSAMKHISKASISSRYLTAALRMSLQWAEHNNDAKLAQMVQAQFDALMKQRLTANFEVAENDILTSVTATADAFMLANDLWRYSGDTRYLEFAQLIYFNGLCSMQNSDCDFVSHSVPSPTRPHLVAMPQAPRESSAQGVEALTHLCRYATAVKADTFYINHLVTEMTGPKMNGNNISMLITSKYPYDEGTIDFMLLKAPDDEVSWKIFLPHWLKATNLKINEQEDSCAVDDKGFVTFKKAFEQYASVSVAIADSSWCDTPLSLQGKAAMRHVLKGPLMLGNQSDSITSLPPKVKLQNQRAGKWKVKGSKATLTPINHMMQPDALDPKVKRMQVLFPLQ